MKIMVIGLGSMGKRRMRLLHEIAISQNLCLELIGTDNRLDRRREAEEQAKELGFDFQTYDSIEAAIENNNEMQIDAVVISTSPLTHAAIIRECLNCGLSIFTELNLVTDGYDDNIALAKDKGCTLFLSSTPIYRDEMRYITDRVHGIDKKLNYTYHVGQYLPDWHSWESYRDFFIGNKKTNGCREILAVELPWLVKAFGEIESVQCMVSKKTELDIDFNDCYNILISHKTGHTGVFTVDVVSRPPIRSLVIIGEEVYIKWDGSYESLMICDKDSKGLKRVELGTEERHREGYNHTIVENMYVTELIDFLAVLNGKKQAEYSFEQDKEILGIIDRIEGV